MKYQRLDARDLRRVKKCHTLRSMLKKQSLADHNRRANQTKGGAK